MSTFDRSLFCERLKQRREEVGYSTQKEFAAAIGVSVQSVNFYEAGKRVPDAETLYILSEQLNCSIEWLIGRTDNVMPEYAYMEDVTGLTESTIEYLSECGFTKKCFPDKHFIFNLLLTERYIEMLVDTVQETVENITQLANPEENIPLLRRERVLQELEEAGANHVIIESEKEYAEIERNAVYSYEKSKIDEQIELCRFRFSKTMDSFLDETAAALSEEYAAWLLNKKDAEKASIQSAIRGAAARGINKA